jgi:F-type H+-transporting ATPase subunit alpha
MATDSVLRPGELKDVLLKEIEAADLEALDTQEVGSVLEVKDGTARVYGLLNAMAGEMLEFTASETGETVVGLALNLEEDNLGAVILGDYLQLKEGDEVRCTGRVLEVPVGEAIIGRVVDPLGNPMDGLGPIKTDSFWKLEYKAPGIVARQPVKEPLQTGLKAVDSMIPIGRGQRELIIGDRGTGKTAIALDTIINQKGEDVICVYVAVGQKMSTVAAVVEHCDGVLHRRGGRRRRPCADAVHRAVRRVRHGRVLHVPEAPPHAVHLRRPVEARAGLPPALAGAASAPGP